MKITELGKFLRKLRLDGEEFMSDMAEKLGISVSGLSYIETGAREFNKEKLYDKIIETYELDEESIKIFDEAIETSRLSININLTKANSYQKGVVLSLARSMENLNKVDAEAIKKILEGK